MFVRKYATAAAVIVAASSLSVVSSNAVAAIICNTATLPITIQAGDGVGIYMNLITGAASTSAVAGWDFNPYDRGLPGVSFWFNNDATKGAVSNGTSIMVLAAGAEIGPASTFSNSVADPNSALWRVAQTGGYVGLRVYNEGTSTMNYGWVQADTGANGLPFTINAFCYQNDGTAITAGTTPVSLQKFSVE